MQLATIWLEMDELKNNLRLTNITPAQAQVLRRQFGKKVPGQAKPTNPITHLKITGQNKRTASNEYSRLVLRYGEKLVTDMFPGENPNCPLTFKDAGFKETEQPEPEYGTKHEILPLAKLPVGDSGEDIEQENISEAEKITPVEEEEVKEEVEA